MYYIFFLDIPYISNKESYRSAIKYFDEVISLNSSNSEAFLYRGLSRQGLSQYFGGYSNDEMKYLICYDFKKAVQLTPRKYSKVENWLKRNGNKNEFGTGKWCKVEKSYGGLIK